MKLIKKILKVLIPRSLLLRSRVRKAEKAMKELNIYSSRNPFCNKKAFIDDYRYSILNSHRGVQQVINIEYCVKHALKNNVKGSFIETGVWTGGASAFALKSFLRNFPKDQLPVYFGFDSFEGMPLPTNEDGKFGNKWIKDESSNPLPKSTYGGTEVNNADYDFVKQYLIETGYPRKKINLIKGWFHESIPQKLPEIDEISVLRLDGDFYESTKVVLELLYAKVSKNGIIIIDDYGGFEGCKKAVDEFIEKNNIKYPLLYVDDFVRFFIKS